MRTAEILIESFLGPMQGLKLRGKSISRGDKVMATSADALDQLTGEYIPAGWIYRYDSSDFTTHDLFIDPSHKFMTTVPGGTPHPYLVNVRVHKDDFNKYFRRVA